MPPSPLRESHLRTKEKRRIVISGQVVGVSCSCGCAHGTRGSAAGRTVNGLGLRSRLREFEDRLYLVLELFGGSGLWFY